MKRLGRLSRRAASPRPSLSPRRLFLESLEDRRVLAPITGVVTAGTLELTGDAAANTLDVSVAGGILNLSAAAGTIDLTALGLGDVAVQAVDLAAEGITRVEIDLAGAGDTVNFGAVAASPGLAGLVVDDTGAAGTDTVNVNGAIAVGGDFSIAGVEATVLANNITTTADQTFNTPITLASNVTITAPNVTFASTIDADDATANNRTLTVTAAGGTVTFEGNVGATQALADLDVTAATIDLNGPSMLIDDQGGNTVTFDGDVVLTANVTIDTDGAADNNVSFTGTIDADDAGANDRTLTVNAGTGTVLFGGDIGVAQALADLDVTAATISLNATTVRVDDQGGNTATFTGAVVLGANVAIDTDGTADNSVVFTSTINADNAAANDRTLTITAGSGSVTFSDQIGTTQALADLDVTAATITFNRAATQTVQVDDQGGNTATLAGGVVLATNLLVDTDGAADNSVAFAGTVDADDAVANARTLMVTADSGTATIGGNVGTTQALADLDVTAATINLNGATIQVDDEGGSTVTFDGAVVLGANVTIDTDGAADNNVRFTGTINADNAAANNRTLTAAAGTGVVAFGDDIGTAEALADLDVTAATIMFIGGAPTQLVQVDDQGGNTATFVGGVVVAINLLTVDTDGAADNSVQFSGTVNADNAGAENRALVVLAGGGSATFSGDVGTGQALADLDVTAATITFNRATPQTVQVDDQGGNTVTFSGAVVVAVDLLTVDTDGATDNSVQFNGSINADNAAVNNRALAVTAGTGSAVFGGDIGAAQALADFDVVAATITFSGASPQTAKIDDQGGNIVTLTGAIVLATNLTVDTDGAADNGVDFDGAINADDATLNNRKLAVVAGGGTVTLGGNVGTTQALADLDVTAGTMNANAPTIKVDDENAPAETLTIDAAVILAANLAIDADRAAGSDNSLTLTGSIDADLEANNRTMTINAGPVTVDAAIGQSQKLLTLSITASGAIDIHENVSTLADITLDAAVTPVTNTPDSSTVTITAGDTVASAGGDVNLTAEDNVVVHGGISATAAGKVIRIASSDTADTPAVGAAGITGSLVDLDGTLVASQILVTGNAENDRFEIAFANITGQTVVRGGANDATLAPGNIRDTAAADVPALKKSDKAPFFLPTIRTFVIGDQLLADDTGATAMANLNTDYVMDGERLRRLFEATPFLAYPDHDLELIKITTGRGNNDFTVNLGTGGAMPEIVQVDTQGAQGSPPDDRLQILGTGGNDNVSIGDINLQPSLAGGALGPIRAHFELNGFQRSWIQLFGGDDVIDNISGVPGLLDGGAGKDVINSIVNHPSSFVLNKKLQNSKPKNVTLVLGNEDADKLFVGSGALGGGVPATPLINALRAFPDKSITFLIGDHRVVADKLTEVPLAKRKGDNYASSATAFQHGFIALNDFTEPAPAPNTSLGLFRFGAGDKIKFSSTIAWLKAQLFVGAAVPKLLTALNTQVKDYTRPVTDAAAEAADEIVEGEDTGVGVLDARLDVNRDGYLSPADALTLINELNAGGSRRVPASPLVEGEAADSEDAELTPTLDVNGDEYLSPADALAVINTLNMLGSQAIDEEAATDEWMEDLAEDESEPSATPAATGTVNMSATDALLAMLASDTAVAKKKGT